MKNLLIALLTLTSFSLFSQAHIGVSGAFDLESEYSKLGVGLNYMPLPKVMIGGAVMITPFDVDDDYEIMLNVKYKLSQKIHDSSHMLYLQQEHNLTIISLLILFLHVFIYNWTDCVYVISEGNHCQLTRPNLNVNIRLSHAMSPPRTPLRFCCSEPGSSSIAVRQL